MNNFLSIVICLLLLLEQCAKIDYNERKYAMQQLYTLNKSMARNERTSSMKRLLALLLSVCVMLGMLPQTVWAEENVSTSAADAIMSQGDGTTVSRIEWLQALTSLFEMTVAEDNYPDNYYADINSSYEYYYDVMLATEFGLVDVAAGEALQPDADATREFAAHTLNMCLGYQVDNDTTYSFSDAGNMTYPKDAQIAVNRGWFTLVDGSFLPDAPITTTEKEIMLADATAVKATAAIDNTYIGSYTFASGITVLPEDTVAVVTSENELTIYDCKVNIQNGDSFGLISGGFPVAYKAVSVSQSGNAMVVETERLATKDAFADIDVQGNMAVDLSQVQAYSDNVTLKYIVGGTVEEEWEDGVKYENIEEVGSQEISAIEMVQTFYIPDDVRAAYEIADGVEAEITCKVSDVNFDYKNDSEGVLAKVNSKISFSCNVSVDVLEAIGEAPEIDLAYVPVCYVGYMKVSLDMSIEGSIVINFVSNIGAGIQYVYGDGFRFLTEFEKEEFTIQADAAVSSGVSFSIGLNCGVLEGYIYGKVGGKAVVETSHYDDGQLPECCKHLGGWMYASMGVTVELDLLVVSDEWGEEIEIYTDSNSPVRVNFHYEDNVAVSECTRDTEKNLYKYYTPADSRYGYNGASKGTGSDGSIFAIFDYEINDEGNAVITSFNGGVSALSIPAKLDGYTVVEIGKEAFIDNDFLKTVVIPDTVTKIGAKAFLDCDGLASVTLSKNVTSIGYYAFYDCDELTSIRIPKSLETTTALNNYEGVFAECDNLEKVSFETGTTKVVQNLFSNCIGLKEIVIPSTVTEIGAEAFYKCYNLSDITYSSNLTAIGENAFGQCNSLTEVVLPNCVTKIDDRAYQGCENIIKLILPSDISFIGYYAFQGCDGLTSVMIPKNLTTVGALNNYEGIFADCDNLSNVTLEPGITQVHDCLLANLPALEQITIPDSVTYIGKEAFLECTALKSITIPDGVTAIGEYAFSGCDSLTTATIPDSVTSISSHIFAGCDNLTTVTLGTGIRNIPTYMFSNCVSLKTVNLPYTIKTIFANAFYKCNSLTEITIPGGTGKIYSDAFTTPENLTIYGESGSYAETFAADVGATFVAKGINTTKVTLDRTELSMVKGDTYALNETIVPYNTTNVVTWTSSDTSVATVSDDGVITAKAGGTTTVTVTAGDYWATCTVTVTVPLTKLYVTYGSSAIYPGKTYKPTVTYTPSAATDKTLTWTSSKPNVMSVDSDGTITVHTVGTSEITATAANGISYTVEVTAKLPSGGYIGNINSELISFDLKQADNGAYYLTGQIVVVEWVNDVSTVPKDKPTMMFKSTDGTEIIDVFVTPTGTNTYYFDRFIEGLSADKEYVFEIASGTADNYSENRVMNVLLSTSPKMLEVRNLGKIGEQKICYHKASNGELRLYRRTSSYVGHINSELLKTELVTGPNGNYVSGQIVVVEWVDGVSTVPFDAPIMYFKSTDGNEELPVFVTPTGTNTYYFDRSLGDLDTSKEYVFTIESGDSLNISPYRSMIVTTAAMTNKTGTLWESATQYVRYRTDDNTGELRIYGVNK